MVAEGVRTTRIVHTIAEREGLHMPITTMLFRVLRGELDVPRALDALMTQPARGEVDAGESSGCGDRGDDVPVAEADGADRGNRRW